MDEQFIKEIGQTILKEIEAKQWYDLSIEEIRMIEDPLKKKKYAKEYIYCFKNFINPLCSSINTKGYKFTDDMSCKQIIKVLKTIYLKNKKTEEDMREVIFERLKK